MGLYDIGHLAYGDGWAAAAVLFALFIAHALGDFAFQGSFLSRAKSRHADLSDLFPEGQPRGIWWNALLAHSLIHAGGVWLITGSVVLAAIELVLHAIIDFTKCENRISFETDQTLHRLCKVLYVIPLYLIDPNQSWCFPFRARDEAAAALDPSWFLALI